MTDEAAQIFTLLICFTDEMRHQPFKDLQRRPVILFHCIKTDQFDLNMNGTMIEMARPGTQVYSLYSPASPRDDL